MEDNYFLFMCVREDWVYSAAVLLNVKARSYRQQENESCMSAILRSKNGKYKDLESCNYLADPIRLNGNYHLIKVSEDELDLQSIFDLSGSVKDKLNGSTKLFHASCSLLEYPNCP